MSSISITALSNENLCIVKDISTTTCGERLHFQKFPVSLSKKIKETIYDESKSNK